MTKQKNKKLLSFVTIGRNDDYIGNFKYRITTCINHLARNAVRLGMLSDIEILVTDWNSDVPLSDELELSADAARMCRFIIVPPAIAQKGSGDMVFNAPYALNVALRRTAGEYTMIVGADFIIDSTALKNLLSLIKGEISVPFEMEKSVFYIRRKLLPWQFMEKEPFLDELDTYISENSWLLSYGMVFPGLASGFGSLLMHSALWHRYRGFDETLPGWGWSDIEIGLRYNQNNPYVVLSGYGIECYDMQQSPLKRKTSIALHNPQVVKDNPVVNDENWGFGDCEFEIKQVANVRDLSVQSIDKTVLNAFSGKKRSELIAELTDVSDIKKHLKKCTPTRVELPREWASLYPVAWYSLKYFPRRFLDVGSSAGYDSIVVGAANPIAEIYAIDSWNKSGWRIAEQGRASREVAAISSMLKQVNYCGNVRFLSGDPGSAIERLPYSLGSMPEFDLVLFRADMFGKGSTAQLEKIIPCLSPGAALVITSSRGELFEEVWRWVKEKYPDFTFICCKEKKTGLMIAASLKAGGTLSEEREGKKLASAWRPLRHMRSLVLLSRVFVELSGLCETLRCEPFWRWPAVMYNVLRGMWVQFKGHPAHGA